MRVAWLLLSCALLVGCLCSSQHIAELSDANGNVERDYEKQVGQWAAAKLGAGFDFGDAVRTDRDANALVLFDDNTKLRLTELTTVRFLRTPPESNERGIDVESGTAVFEAGDKPSRLRTQLGLAVLTPGTILHVGKTVNGARLFVEVGLAQLESATGEPRTLQAGETVEVTIGMAIFEPEPQSEPELPVAPVEQEPHAEEPTPIVAQVQGPASVKAPDANQFRVMDLGEQVLAPGSQLKLSKGSELMLSRGREQAKLTGPGSFVVGPEGKPLVQPLSGSVTLTASGRDVTMTTPDATVTAQGKDGLSVVDVSVSKKGGTQVLVRAGRASVSHVKGTTVLTAGENATVRGATIEIGGRGPSYFDIPAQLGSSLLIHDAAPPTVVGFSASEHCDALTVVEVLSGGRVAQRSVGQKRVNLAFPAGSYKYQSRCLSADGILGEPEAGGALTVYADSGSRTLPTTAPTNFVNADGRTYTLLYQHRLPAVTVRWPNAPPSPSYSLSVTSDTGSRSIKTTQANYTFPSGGLNEGKYTFQFHTAHGRDSRVSSANIRFDNAAPKASIGSPANGSFSAGATVSVQGIALPGWTVTVQGRGLATDAQGRFSGSAIAGSRGVVFQFTHPARGVHHYLRRAKGAAP